MIDKVNVLIVGKGGIRSYPIDVDSDYIVINKRAYPILPKFFVRSIGNNLPPIIAFFENRIQPIGYPKALDEGSIPVIIGRDETTGEEILGYSGYTEIDRLLMKMDLNKTADQKMKIAGTDNWLKKYWVLLMIGGLFVIMFISGGLQ